MSNSSAKRTKQAFDVLEVGKKIAANSCVLEFHTRQPGFKRRIKSDVFLGKSGNNANVDPYVLHVSQDLIDRRELREIKALKRRLVNYLDGMTVPGGLLTLGNGQYLVPIQAIESIDSKIQEFIINRQKLLDDFESRYETIKENSKISRGEFYDEDDYPPFDMIRSRYNTEYKFSSNAVPDELAKASKELYNREKIRIENECAIAAQEIRDALRQAFKELVAHMAERLGMDESGNYNVFHEARITKLQEFIDTFKIRNLTDDHELEEMIEKARALIHNVDVEAIRENGSIRKSLSESFNKVKKESDKLVVIKPKRKFDLGD